jgi:hypothetical protein
VKGIDNAKGCSGERSLRQGSQKEIVTIEGIWEQNGRAFPDLRLKTDFHNKNQSQKPQKCVLCE